MHASLHRLQKWSRSTAAILITAAAIGLCGAAGAAHAGGAAGDSGSSRIALVLDASGSMNARLADGQTRFDAARAAVSDMIAKLPGDTSIALRVYGHQSRPADKNCQDTELVTPFGPAAERGAEITAKISQLQALGYTPISLSLQNAAEDLSNDGAQRGQSGGTVILVSDGKETCNADPCAVSQALARANASLVVHTIGFGVDDATRRQLQCVANVARGSYFDANSSGELAGRLSEAARSPAKPEPPPAKPMPQVGVLTIKGIDEAGVEVTNSSTNEHAGVVGTVGSNRLELPAGIYGVRLLNGLWTGVQIRAGETTELVPAYLKIVTPSETNLTLVDLETSEQVGTVHQSSVPIVALVPGTYQLVTDQGFSFGAFEFKAGATTELNPGVFRIAGGKANHFYAIKPATGDIASASIVAGDHVSLPPGRYVVNDPDDESAPAVEIELKAGEAREISMPP